MVAIDAIALSMAVEAYGVLLLSAVEKTWDSREDEKSESRRSVGGKD